MTNPILVEPGTKFFFKQTLKTCHARNLNFYNNLYNGILLLIFVSIIGSFLYYKKTHRLSQHEIINKKRENRVFVIEKLKKYNDSMMKQSQNLITNLPMYKNEFR
jgi:hypothetical protein